MPKGVSSKYGFEERSTAMKKVWRKKGHREKVEKGQIKAFASKEYHDRQSAAQTNRWANEQNREKQSKKLVDAWNEPGARQVWSHAIKESNTVDLCVRKSKTRKSRMRDDPNFGSVGLAKILAKRSMTKSEKKVRTILRVMKLPYEYVGNGKVMIGRYCPDFIHADYKSIIEVYSDYWHKRPENVGHDKKRIRFIKKQGYRILIIWQHELIDLKQVCRKIRKFDAKILDKVLTTGKTQTPLE